MELAWIVVLGFAILIVDVAVEYDYYQCGSSTIVITIAVSLLPLANIDQY